MAASLAHLEARRCLQPSSCGARRRRCFEPLETGLKGELPDLHNDLAE